MNWPVLILYFCQFQGRVLSGYGASMNHKTLKISNVTSEKRGLYTCVVSNEEGDGQSNAVNLNVQCKYLRITREIG